DGAVVLAEEEEDLLTLLVTGGLRRDLELRPDLASQNLDRDLCFGPRSLEDAFDPHAHVGEGHLPEIKEGPTVAGHLENLPLDDVLRLRDEVPEAQEPPGSEGRGDG